MQKKSIVITIIAIILLAIGAGVWKWEKIKIKKQEQAKNQQIQQEEAIKEEEKKNQENAEIDMSDWKTYRNKELGFEFTYPRKWTIEELSIPSDSSGVHPDWIFRYLSIKGANFTIVFGVKDAVKEKNVQSRSWRTGIPAGIFVKKGTIHIGDGLAEKRYLIYKNDTEPHIQLVWYCNLGEDVEKCNNFSIGKNKTAFVEIEAIDSNTASWNEIEIEVENMLKSVRVFNIVSLNN